MSSEILAADPRLAEIAGSIRNEIEAAGNSFCTIGALLEDAKAICGDTFTAWLRDEFNWTEAFASKLIGYRSNHDKRLVAEAMLRISPSRSNRAIGQAAGVSKDTINTVRKELVATGEISQLEKTVGADGKARKQPERKAGSDRTILEGSPTTDSAPVQIEASPSISPAEPASPPDIPWKDPAWLALSPEQKATTLANILVECLGDQLRMFRLRLIELACWHDHTLGDSKAVMRRSYGDAWLLIDKQLGPDDDGGETAPEPASQEDPAGSSTAATPELDAPPEPSPPADVLPETNIAPAEPAAAPRQIDLEDAINAAPPKREPRKSPAAAQRDKPGPVNGGRDVGNLLQNGIEAKWTPTSWQIMRDWVADGGSGKPPYIREAGNTSFTIDTKTATPDQRRGFVEAVTERLTLGAVA